MCDCAKSIVSMLDGFPHEFGVLDGEGNFILIQGWNWSRWWPASRGCFYGSDIM
jgi:hypothetical protein